MAGIVARAEVEFLLTGDGIPFDDVSNALGLPATRTWRAGDAIQGTLLRRKCDAWAFGTRQTEAADLGASVSELLSQLAPIAHLVRSVSERYRLNAELSCAVYVNGGTPEIHLERRQVHELASLQAALDIDVIVTES